MQCRLRSDRDGQSVIVCTVKELSLIHISQAQFASVTQIAPTFTDHCSNPLPAQIIATGTTSPSCYATADQGYPSGLVTSFNPATDNITYIPKNNKASYVESYFLSIQRSLSKNTLLDVACLLYTSTADLAAIRPTTTWRRWALISKPVT